MKTRQIKSGLDSAGCRGVLWFFSCLLLAGAHGLCADNAQGQKATLEGLDFWIEFPSKQFPAWGSVPGYMHLSNTLDAPHRFSEMKSRYYDTSIGDFVVELPDGTPVESFVTVRERIASSLGSKGLFIDPHSHLSSLGYLDRTFDLTNPGIYRISALVRIVSSNWNGDFPVKWQELRSPAVEIEILPSTNARPVRPRVDIPPEPTNPTKTQPTSTMTVPAKPLESVIQNPALTAGAETRAPAPSDLKSFVAPEIEPPPIVSGNAPPSATHGRDLTFAVLTLLPIVGFIVWIVWRRTRKAD